MLFSYLPFFSVSRGGYRAREMMLHYRVQIASNKRWFRVNTLKFVLLCCDLKGDWFVSPLFAIGTAGYVQPQQTFIQETWNIISQHLKLFVVCFWYVAGIRKITFALRMCVIHFIAKRTDIYVFANHKFRGAKPARKMFFLDVILSKPQVKNNGLKIIKPYSHLEFFSPV